MPPPPSTLDKVLFSMTGELVKFGVVMLVVMSGFVVSFYSIFQHNVTFGMVRFNFFHPCVDVAFLRRMFTGSRQKTMQHIVVPEGVGGARSAAMGWTGGTGEGSRRELCYVPA